MVIGEIVRGLFNTDLLFFVKNVYQAKLQFGQLSFWPILCFITFWQTKKQEKHDFVGVGGTAFAWQTVSAEESSIAASLVGERLRGRRL